MKNSIITASAIAVFACTQTAAANTLGNVTITNMSPYQITYTVLSEGWNCNDYPLRGETFSAGPGFSVAFRIMRKDGHGCGDEQGVFLLQMTAYGMQTLILPFSQTRDSCLVPPNELRRLTYIVHMSGNCPNYSFELFL